MICCTLLLNTCIYGTPLTPKLFEESTIDCVGTIPTKFCTGYLALSPMAIWVGSKSLFIAKGACTGTGWLGMRISFGKVCCKVGMAVYEGGAIPPKLPSKVLKGEVTTGLPESSVRCICARFMSVKRDLWSNLLVSGTALAVWMTCSAKLSG